MMKGRQSMSQQIGSPPPFFFLSLVLPEASPPWRPNDLQPASSTRSPTCPEPTPPPPLWIRSTNFCENFSCRRRLHLSSSNINCSDKSGQPSNELCEPVFVTSDAPTHASGLRLPEKRQDRRECSDPAVAKF